MAVTLPVTRMNLIKPRVCSRLLSQVATEVNRKLNIPAYINFEKSFNINDRIAQAQNFLKGMTVIEDFISVEEEQTILDEIEPYMKRMRYEFDHWDNAIHGYRETERLNWNDNNKLIIQRIRDIAFPPGTPQIQYVHVLDLDKKGYIKPHIDAVRFCGNTIAGLSLLTDSVMRYVHEKETDLTVDVLLKRRSLYIVTHDPRYLYTHEILKNEESQFKGKKVEKDRRISVICRNEPDKTSL